MRVRKLLALVTCLVTGLAETSQACAAELEVPPGFVVQILEPIGGKIARPKEWFYSEQHQPPTLRWTLSKEDPALGPYETGMRVQLFIGVEKGTGKTPRQFVSDIVKSRKAAGRVLSECPPENQGLFTRVCLETEERLPAMGSRLFRVRHAGGSVGAVPLHLRRDARIRPDRSRSLPEVTRLRERQSAAVSARVAG